jgi:hypothetical protein
MLLTVGPTDSDRPQQHRDSTKDFSKAFKLNRFRQAALNNVKVAILLSRLSGRDDDALVNDDIYTSVCSVISFTCVAAITYPGSASLYLLSI